jgi:hypothetical protein
MFGQKLSAKATGQQSPAMPAQTPSPAMMKPPVDPIVEINKKLDQILTLLMADQAKDQTENAPAQQAGGVLNG